MRKKIHLRFPVRYFLPQLARSGSQMEECGGGIIIKAIVSSEFSPVVEIGVSKGHISPQETTPRNTTFELYLTWLVFDCNQ